MPKPDSDRLEPAVGIVNGLVLGLALWILIAP